MDNCYGFQFNGNCHSQSEQDLQDVQDGQNQTKGF